jgi:NitT/TauT family transport system substrate-binding protein
LTKRGPIRDIFAVALSSMSMGKLRLWSRVAVAALLLAAATTACGGGGGGGGTAAGAGGRSGTVHLGVLPNVTLAPVLAGLEQGLYTDALGAGVKLDVKSFGQGSDLVEAMLAGSLDLGYFGPNPAINAWSKAKGELQIIAGSTSGGAALVVKPGIASAADLVGKTVATPKLGNTQDVALRAWLKDQGYETTPEGGGDVKIQPQDNALTLSAFESGSIAGAWVPEPWATRLVTEGGGKVLVDERTLWPGGKFVTVHLVARTKFLDQHADLVKAFLEGHVAAVDFVLAHAATAQADVARKIEELTGQAVSKKVVAGAWPNMEFTEDPLARTLQVSADHAEAIGLLDHVDLRGIYRLDLLNEVLRSAGKPTVRANLS